MNDTVKVGVMVLLLQTLAKNTGKISDKILDTIVNGAKKKFGDIVGNMTDVLLIDKTGAKHRLTYSLDGLSDTDQSINPIMKLLGAMFSKFKNLVIANLTSSSSGWSKAQTNSFCFKVLKHFGFITGKNSNDWSLAINKDTKKYPFNALLRRFLTDDDIDLLNIEEYVVISDEIVLDDEVDINLDDDVDDDEVVLTDDSNADGLSIYKGIMSKYYNGDPKQFVASVLSKLATKLTDACKKGAQLVMVKANGETTTRYTNKEALKALKDGDDSYTVSFNNKSTTTKFAKLADQSVASIKNTLLNGIMLSLHVKIKPKSVSDNGKTYDLLREHDITDTTTLVFVGQCAAFILDALENGADVEDFGYGFIQHLNIDAVDAMFDKQGITLPSHKALTNATKRKINDGKAIDKLDSSMFGFIE